MNNQTILEVIGLNKSYNNLDKEVKIINELNLEVNKGEFLCILGPSGCGKTTLLRCICGFEQYDGQIIVNNREVKEPGKDRILVFQDFNQLFPWKTVIENVKFSLKMQGVKDRKILEEEALKYLKKVGLDSCADLYPHQLSGGMKQRVAIAKALVVKPNLVLMDEPFASLDAMTRKKLQKELLNISIEENVTIIFVTHNIQEAIVLGSRILVMTTQGKITLDIKNPLTRPITPATLGYPELWTKFNEALGV